MYFNVSTTRNISLSYEKTVISKKKHEFELMIQIFRNIKLINHISSSFSSLEYIENLNSKPSFLSYDSITANERYVDIIKNFENIEF